MMSKLFNFLEIGSRGFDPSGPPCQRGLQGGFSPVTTGVKVPSDMGIIYMNGFITSLFS